MIRYSLPRLLPLVPIGAACLAFNASAAFGRAAAAQQTNVLWYAQPARSWMTEALPIGNGSLGGMLFGLTEHRAHSIQCQYPLDR